MNKTYPGKERGKRDSIPSREPSGQRPGSHGESGAVGCDWRGLEWTKEGDFGLKGQGVFENRHMPTPKILSRKENLENNEPCFS